MKTSSGNHSCRRRRLVRKPAMPRGRDPPVAAHACLEGIEAGELALAGGPSTAKTSTGRFFPLTRRRSTLRHSKRWATRCLMASLISRSSPYSLVAPSRREPRLTQSPMAVSSARSWEPISPTTASPWWRPMPMASSMMPRWRQPVFSSARADRMARLASTARQASSTRFGLLGIVAEAAPDRHHGIADEFIDGPLPLEDDGHHALEVFVELGDHFLGGELFAHAGVAADVGKQDDDGAIGSFADGVIKFRVLDDLFGDIRRVKAHDRSLEREFLPSFEQEIVAESAEPDEPVRQQRGAGMGDKGGMVEQQHLADEAEGDGRPRRTTVDQQGTPECEINSQARGSLATRTAVERPPWQAARSLSGLGGGEDVGVDPHPGDLPHRGGVKILLLAGHASEEMVLPAKRLPEPASFSKIAGMKISCNE